MVRFKKVEMENFTAIKEAKLDLENQGLVLIEGVNKSNDSFDSNGSAKSSLLSSITYALYGKTEKGLSSDDVVNNIEKKNTKVQLEFSIGKDEYRIERYRKHKKFKNKVKLFCNGKEITGSTNAVTDKQILELFGIDFNTYVNAIMYGQGDIPMFSQATDKGKKEILESITNVEVYKKAQDVAKEKIKEVEEKQQQEQNEIEKLNYRLEINEEQFNKDMNYYNEVMEKKEQEEKEYQNKLSEFNKNIEDIDTEISSYKDTLTDVEIAPYEYPSEYENLLNRIEQGKSILQERIVPLITGADVDIKTCLNKISSLNEKLKTLDTSSTCPVCGSPIDNSHKLKEKESIEQDIQRDNQYLEFYRNQKEKAESKQQEITGKLNTLQEEVNKYQQEKDNHDKKVQNEYAKQQQIYNYISSLENKKNNLVKPVLNDYSYIKEPSKEEYDKEKEDISKSIDKHKDNVVELETKKSRYKDAVDAFSNKGIRSVVLDFITPFLNEKANKYLQTLSGSDIEIEFQTQVKNSKGELKDKFDVIVKNSNGGESYKSNSAGEQKRIDLAISFAIQDLIMSKDEISTNIALYDECFDGLDTIGCENVVNLLKDRLNTVGTIFVITHNQSLKPLFENVITMVKENGVSRLEKGE